MRRATARTRIRSCRSTIRTPEPSSPRPARTARHRGSGWRRSAGAAFRGVGDDWCEMAMTDRRQTTATLPLVVIGSATCEDTAITRSRLESSDVPYEYVDID